MPGPAVSILLPVYDAADTLSEAIDSICAQTWPDWELIVFDDGSTDGTLEVAQSFARNDRRIRVLPSAHAGIVDALRNAAKAAEGPYLARMDGDDIAQPVRLERQMEAMAADNDLALCGTHVTMFGESIGEGRRLYETWLNHFTCHEEMAREIFIECPIAHPTFLMRRSWFECVGGYQDRGWPEDYDLVMRLYLAGGRLGTVPEALLAWREHGHRLSMTDGRYSLEAFRRLKRHYLFESYLSDGKPFYQWGAGQVGKAWLREWGHQRPTAVVDIHPRKIGKRIHGVRVIEPDDLPPPGTTRTLVAVGAPGAREDIRNWMSERRYREGTDYIFVA